MTTISAVTKRNTDEDRQRYPFPFMRDSYRYSANVEQARVLRKTSGGGWGEQCIAIDGHYHEELRERARILKEDSTRSQCLPHMLPAAWDALLTVMRELSRDYPQIMSLTAITGSHSGEYRWQNKLLKLDQTFAFGDSATLPVDPLTYIGSQIQEDVLLLDQREQQLWIDAGIVTFAADWSLNFDVGMSFKQIHSPVPRVAEEKIVERAQAFIMRLQPEKVYRRTNWTLTIDGKLDTSVETYPQWGKDRRKLNELPLEKVGDHLFLRTETQHLFRLRTTGAIMFTIRSYLLSFRDLAQVPEWAQTTYRVITELPDDMADYKGISRTRVAGLNWLREYAGVTPI